MTIHTNILRDNEKEIAAKIHLRTSSSEMCCGIMECSGLHVDLSQGLDNEGYTNYINLDTLTTKEVDYLFQNIVEHLQSRFRDTDIGLLYFSDTIDCVGDYSIDSDRPPIRGFSFSDFAEYLGIEPLVTGLNKNTDNEVALFAINRETLENINKRVV